MDNVADAMQRALDTIPRRVEDSLEMNRKFERLKRQVKPTGDDDEEQELPDPIRDQP